MNNELSRPLQNESTHMRWARDEIDGPPREHRVVASNLLALLRVGPMIAAHRLLFRFRLKFISSRCWGETSSSRRSIHRSGLSGLTRFHHPSYSTLPWSSDGPGPPAVSSPLHPLFNGTAAKRPWIASRRAGFLSSLNPNLFNSAVRCPMRPA